MEEKFNTCVLIRAGVSRGRTDKKGCLQCRLISRVAVVTGKRCPVEAEVGIASGLKQLFMGLASVQSQGSKSSLIFSHGINASGSYGHSDCRFWDLERLPFKDFSLDQFSNFNFSSTSSPINIPTRPLTTHSTASVTVIEAYLTSFYYSIDLQPYPLLIFDPLTLHLVEVAIVIEVEVHSRHRLQSICECLSRVLSFSHILYLMTASFTFFRPVVHTGYAAVVLM